MALQQPVHCKTKFHKSKNIVVLIFKSGFQPTTILTYRLPGGSISVNATGKITYMDKEVKAEIQFIVNKDNGTFNMNAFEMNGIPQNVFMVAGLINKMF